MPFPPLPEIPEPLRGNSFVIVEAVALLGEAEATAALAPLRDLGAAMDTFARAARRDRRPPHGPAGARPLRRRRDAARRPAGRGDRRPARRGRPGVADSELLSVELRHDGGAMAAPTPPTGRWTLPGSFLMFGVGDRPQARRAGADQGVAGGR